MTIQSPAEFDVFLSHSHLDADLVEILGARLEDEAQMRVWLDRWVLVPGEHWQQEMAKGLGQARTCAVCIGQQASTGWFREEIQRALNRQVKDQSFRVIPVLLPNADKSLVDDFLELRTWAEFKTGIDDRYAFHVLVSGIQGKPPGRNPYRGSSSSELDPFRDKLHRIRLLRDEQLIDADIAIEYQRRLLDKLLEQ